MCEHVVACVVVWLGVADEDAELAVETAFDVLAVIGEAAGFVFEVSVFLLGIDVLFEALDR